MGIALICVWIIETYLHKSECTSEYEQNYLLKLTRKRKISIEMVVLIGSYEKGKRAIWCTMPSHCSLFLMKNEWHSRLSPRLGVSPFFRPKSLFYESFIVPPFGALHEKLPEMAICGQSGQLCSLRGNPQGLHF